ncbi:hypothetical protein T261_0810 [Streptomyces lydicus]|nr:hypothetical protein T261_0810 [Streptomyces lydicus]
MPTYQPDFRLDGYDAVNDHVDEQFWGHVAIEQDMLTVLAEHHTGDDQHSFYVMHNGAVTWGIPGLPQIVALHLKRDTDARTFRFDHAELPLPVMAQSWLIARGCPEDRILLSEGMDTAPADQATRVLEERLRSDGDHFALLTSYTDDDAERPQTTVLLRALDERSPLPFRVLLEEIDSSDWTYTLTEGGFATFEAATDWWERHWHAEGVPLPSASPSACQAAVLAAPALPALPAPPRGPSR